MSLASKRIAYGIITGVDINAALATAMCAGDSLYPKADAQYAEGWYGRTLRKAAEDERRSPSEWRKRYAAYVAKCNRERSIDVNQRETKIAAALSAIERIDLIAARAGLDPSSGAHLADLRDELVQRLNALTAAPYVVSMTYNEYVAKHIADTAQELADATSEYEQATLMLDLFKAAKDIVVEQLSLTKPSSSAKSKKSKARRSSKKSS